MDEDDVLVGEPADSGMGDSLPSSNDDDTVGDDRMPGSDSDDSGTSDDGDGDGESGDSEGGEPHRGRASEKRIRQLVAKGKEKDREIEYWKMQAVKGGPAAGSPAPSVTPPRDPDIDTPLPKPDPAAFENFDAYEAAKDDWLLKEGERRAAVKFRDEKKRADVRSRRDQVTAMIQEAVNTDKTFQAAASDPTFIQTDVVQQLIIDSDDPVAILKHLHSNRSTLDKLNRMDQISAARFMGKLEAQLSRPSPSPVRKVSDAPAPVRSVVNSGGVSSVPDDEMDTGTWMAHERKRIAEARRR